MEFFSTLPIHKNSDKPININDSSNVKIGFIRRSYKSFFDQFLSYLPLSFLETRNITGEFNEYKVKIVEQGFQSNLLKLKWDVYLQNSREQEVCVLEDKTKVSTNPRMLYHKNIKGYLFQKDNLSRTCQVYCRDSNLKCAEIKIEKLFPTSLKIVDNTKELTIIELISIYYIMNLVY